MASESATTTRNFLIDKVLKNFSGLPDKDVTEKLSVLKRNKVSRPVIYIGTGTCGIVAGALETRDTISKYLSDKKIAADLIEVGCIGMCSAEPVVDVQLPGKTRLSFGNVTSDRVEDILDATFRKLPPADDIIGQYATLGAEPWTNIPRLDGP